MVRVVFWVVVVVIADVIIVVATVVAFVVDGVVVVVVVVVAVVSFVVVVPTKDGRIREASNNQSVGILQSIHRAKIESMKSSDWLKIEKGMKKFDELACFKAVN